MDNNKINRNTTQVINIQSRNPETNISHNLVVNSFLGNLGIAIFKRIDGTSSLMFRQPIQPFISHTTIPKRLEKLLKMEPGGEESFSLKRWNPEEKKWFIEFNMSFKRSQENKPLIIISSSKNASSNDKVTVKFTLQMIPKVELSNVSEYNKTNEYIEGLINDLKLGTNRAIIASLQLIGK